MSYLYSLKENVKFLYTVKAYGRLDIQLRLLTSTLDKVSGQLHSPTVLTHYEKHRVTIQ